ncbi:MAG: cytochrome C [Desulfuromonadales bacterium]|nr:MAG: cytochrome C [Desulfuromonadales bacterium]
MGRFVVVLALFVWCAAVGTSWGGTFECKVCHSKKPGMVKMHEAVRGRGCFGCHKVGEKLMGKGEPKDTGSLMKRRAADPLCVECHGKVSAPASGSPRHPGVSPVVNQ